MNDIRTRQALVFEAVRAQDANDEWIVEAIDDDREGEVYVARFSGPGAADRAAEYAAWKNSGVPATTDQNVEPCSGLEDIARRTDATFANLIVRAYLDASDEVRAVIDTMSRICVDPKTDPQDCDSALDTLTDALFPQMHKGEFGIDLSDVKVIPSPGG